jgi:hypothetical protein
MIGVKTLLLDLAFVSPLLCFLVAALRLRPQNSQVGLGVWVLILLGACLNIILFLPLPISPHGSILLSRTMVGLSILIGVSSFFFKIRSTVAHILLPIGSLLLAFFWFFSRVADSL